MFFAKYGQRIRKAALALTAIFLSHTVAVHQAQALNLDTPYQLELLSVTEQGISSSFILGLPPGIGLFEELTSDSTATFGSNGVFSLDAGLVTGHLNLAMGFNTQDLALVDSLGRVDLKPSYEQRAEDITQHLVNTRPYDPALDVNMDGRVNPFDVLLQASDIYTGETDPNTYKNVGLFQPNTTEGGMPEFLFFAVNMDARYLNDGRLIFWYRWYSPAGNPLAAGDVVFRVGQEHAPIPEPGTLSLLGAAVLGGAMGRRRMRGSSGSIKASS